ncbi:MAG: hypothetical protein Q9165_006464 [Trypethelium subeluteriae]
MAHLVSTAIGLTARVTRQINTLSERITILFRSQQEVPVEILELTNQLRSLHSVVNAAQEIGPLSRAFREKLNNSDTVIEEVHRVWQQYQEDFARGKSGRAKWALRGRALKATCSRLSQKLNTSTTSLELVLVLQAEKMLQANEMLQSEKIEHAEKMQARGNLAQWQGLAPETAPEIIIAVMGQTGSGKSHFVQNITRREDVVVGHTHQSETQSVQAYPITVEDRLLTFVDTPGFDDTSRSDIEVLAEVATWMAEKLVGIGSFLNISLVTTMWDLLPDISVGYERENELKENYWRPFIEKGSITARSFGDMESALIISTRVAFDQRMSISSGTSAAHLAIQRETVEEHKPLEETSAGQELVARLDEMKRGHQDQLRQFEKENKEGRDQMQTESDVLRGEQAKLKDSRLQRNGREYDNQANAKTTIHVRWTAEELLQLCPPPRSEPEATSQGSNDDLSTALTFTQMLRKDKLANRDGHSATASVMKTAVPTEEEAAQYKYTFDPIPMDEPPMDPRTFNHYFRYPHEADTDATWIERFPKLEDVSLYWNGPKLAKGWGIEITEERNWMLFVCATLIGLLISGTVAGLCAHFMHNISAGLAIGSWLSAVQSLANAALFLHWSRK